MINEPIWGFDSKDVIKWMEMALNVAKDSIEECEVPIGAILVDSRNGFVVASASNTPSKSMNATHHAEILIINQVYKKFHNEAKKILEHAICVVTIEPCVMCCGALQLAGISRVIYGAHNSKFGGHKGALNVTNWLASINFKSGILTSQTIAPLKEFYNNPNTQNENKSKRKRSPNKDK